MTDSRRDTMGDGDTFQMIFDTHRDRQNGFIFGTNVSGVEYDAQVRNEGQTRSGGAPPLGGTSRGSGGGVNANWDGSWEVRTHRSDVGWTMEFRIPLRTLRYGPPPQTWGVNFTRNIRRKREEVFWSPVSRIYGLTRLSSAGDLENLDIAPPRNLQVIPYAISSANRDYTSATATDLQGDFGIDAKFGVTSSLNLDLTYNTDFAQVEVDEQQINLTRFNLRFPEKRPFFLENRGLLAVGKNGEVDLFFSRRIGVEWRPHFSYESFWGFDGFQDTATLHLDNAWDFENGYSVSPAVNIQWEGLRVPFEVYPGVIVPSGPIETWWEPACRVPTAGGLCPPD